MSIFDISDTVSVFTTGTDGARYQVTSGSYYSVVRTICSMSSDLDTHGAVMSIVSDDGRTEDITITGDMSQVVLSVVSGEMETVCSDLP